MMDYEGENSPTLNSCPNVDANDRFAPNAHVVFTVATENGQDNSAWFLAHPMHRMSINWSGQEAN